MLQSDYKWGTTTTRTRTTTKTMPFYHPSISLFISSFISILWIEIFNGTSNLIVVYDGVWCTIWLCHTKLCFALLHIFENEHFQSNDIIMHREPEEPSRVTDSRQIAGLSQWACIDIRCLCSLIHVISESMVLVLLLLITWPVNKNNKRPLTASMKTILNIIWSERRGAVISKA